MKKLVVVTNLLAHYQIDFFNRFSELYNDIELTVFADIECNAVLNNYDKDKCHFNVINSSMRNVKGIVFRKSIKEKINKINPDFLVFYGNPREFSLILLMLFYRITGRKFNVHGMFHRIGGQTLASKIYYKLMGFIADKCFTYSRKGAEVLLGLGVNNKKVKVIGTAIDENKSIYYSGLISDQALEDFKFNNNVSNKKIVLQVVRLSKIKKPDFILDIAGKLIPYRSDIVFVLIGGGDMYDEIKDKIESLGLNNIVLLLGPIYDEKVLSYWFRAAKVFVMPTCIGLSAHHAFSYSLPVITDDNLLEQASEFDVLSNGLNSIIYKSGNIDSFEESILKVIDDEDLQCFLSRNALHTVKYVNSLDSKCENYFNAL